MLTWGSTLPVLFLLAASSEKQKSNPALKYVWMVVVLLGIGAIIVLMLRSIGIDTRTPPSVIVRKLRLLLLSWLRPILAKKKFAQAEELDSKGDVKGALQIYLGLFDFDGMLSSNSKLAIYNETILERIEDICERSKYEFPAEQINRFREDIFDYHLVRQRYLNPSDYDGTPLHRKENEERFKSKLNFSQETELIEGFRHFITTFGEKLTRHLGQGRPVAKAKPKPTISDSSASFESLPASSVRVSEQEDEPLPLPPLQEPKEAFSRKDANPFAINDPKVPFQDATGTLRRLPGAEDDPALRSQKPASPLADPFGSFLDQKAASNGHTAPSVPAAPSGSASTFPPTPGLPQPTSAFPSLGPSPAMASAKPGFPAPTPGFPAPTSAFPSFGTPAQGATPSMSNLPAAPGFPGAAAPSPFPGFGAKPQGPTPSMSNLPAAPGFPGAAAPGFPGAAAPSPFPGFGGAAQPPAPSLGPAASPRPGGFPAPTGAFPGFAPPSQPNAASPLPNFPAPTGAFSGFGQQPSPTQGPTPGFPAPTGAFPGFPSPASTPFGTDPKKK